MKRLHIKLFGKLVVSGLLFTICAGLLSACAGESGNARTEEGGTAHGGKSGTSRSDEDAVTLDIGIAFPEDDWRAAYFVDFASEIEENSDGSIKTAMHFSDEYEDMTDLLKELNKDSGKLDIILAAEAYLPDYSIPDFYVSGLPYMFEDFEDAWRFAESDINAQIEAKLPDYGMRVLSHFCGGFRNIAAIRTIEQPQDLEGLVVATVKSPILMDMLSTLGAEPQISVALELHDALEKGVYTGFEVSLATFWRDKDYQYLPYVAITNHAYNLWSLIIDEDTWQELSDEEQKVIREAAMKYAEKERMDSRSHTEEIISELEDAGVAVSFPDHEPFQDATEEVRRKYSSDYADTYEQVMVFLEEQKG